MRGKIEILADILRACRDRSSKTSIVYSANLSFQQGARYLETLQEKGLIKSSEYSTKKYQITDRGKRFLSIFSNLEDIAGEFEEY